MFYNAPAVSGVNRGTLIYWVRIRHVAPQLVACSHAG
jgi:hypothetical protein